MTYNNLQNIIENGWDSLIEIEKDTKVYSDLKEAIKNTLDLLDSGNIRIANKINDNWQVNSWIKKAILLSFKMTNNELIDSSYMYIDNQNSHYKWFDKVKLKFDGWNKEDFVKAGIRAVPGSIVRHSAFIDQNVVLMPSFVNIGAHVGAGTMIDTWATIGSCAQIGKNCHISGGTGIGGVLEPLQNNPVIIEDNCFIGARSEIAEGVIVREGSVVSMGVFIGASTKIVNRSTGIISYGEVPPYSVVVPGVLPNNNRQPLLSAAIIVKTVDQKTRSKTSINDILRS